MKIRHPFANVTFWIVLIICLIIASVALNGAEPTHAIPAATAADWAANPQHSLQAVLAENDKLAKLVKEYEGLGSWIAWGGGLVTLMLGLARMFPGPTQVIADMAYNFWATRQSKAQEQKRDVMAKGFMEVASIMRMFPADTQLGDVLNKLNGRLPEEVKQAYREWERHEAKPRPHPRNATALVAHDYPESPAKPVTSVIA